MIYFVLFSCSQNLHVIQKAEKKVPRKTLSLLEGEFKKNNVWTDDGKLNSFKETKIHPSKLKIKKKTKRRDLILLKKAKMSFKKKDFKSSIKNLESLEKKFPNSDILNKSRLQLALAYFKIGEKTKAYNKLEENIKKENISGFWENQKCFPELNV